MLDEAIKALRDLLPAPKRYEKALKLGIEALEAYYALRRCSAIDVEDITPLPSETEWKDPTAGFTDEELADLRDAASDNIIG